MVFVVYAYVRFDFGYAVVFRLAEASQSRSTGTANSGSTPLYVVPPHLALAAPSVGYQYIITMSDSESSPLSFTIRLSNGNRWSTTLGVDKTSVLSTSVLDVKQHLASLTDQEYVKDTPVSAMKLIFKGRILDNDRMLSDYAIDNGATIFLVKAPASGPASAPSSAPTVATSPAPSNFGSSSSPFGFPFGNPAAGASGNNSNNPWAMPDMSRPPTREQMQQTLNNPLLQGMLQNNPDMMRHMMQQQMEHNPQLRSLLDSNPQVRHMLNDPAAWEQVVNMMRNPDAMQQALRSQDLALSQLENMPGGMAALQSMFHSTQAPLEESMMMGGSSDSSGSTAPNDGGSAGASGQAMPNPWGSPSQSNINNSRSSNASSSSNPWATLGAGGGGGSTSGVGGGGNSNSNNILGMVGMADPSNMSPQQREQMLQMMESTPGLQSMMQTTFRQNPEFFRNMIMQQNPGMAAMFGSNPAMLDQMIESMLNPSNMRAMMNMQDQMQQMNIGGAGRMDFSSLIGGMGGPASFAGGLPSGAAPFAGAQQQEQPPADRFSTQLQSLYNMGFDDEQRNLAVLQSVHGNLNRAVDELLAGPAPVAAPPATSEQPSSSENSKSEPPKNPQDKKDD